MTNKRSLLVLFRLVLLILVLLLLFMFLFLLLLVLLFLLGLFHFLRLFLFLIFLRLMLVLLFRLACLEVWLLRLLLVVLDIRLLLSFRWMLRLLAGEYYLLDELLVSQELTREHVAGGVRLVHLWNLDRIDSELPLDFPPLRVVALARDGVLRVHAREKLIKLRAVI